MKLFEVTNGYVGDSFVAAYAWAEDEAQALELARESFEREAHRGVVIFLNGKKSKPRYGPGYYTSLKVRELFDSSAEPFCTVPLDGGWP